MLITSHLAATLLVARGLAMPSPELIAALAGGVALDLDHLFVNRKWLADTRNFLAGRGVTHGEVKQHSWLQEPLFGIVAGIAAGLAIASLWPIRWWILPLAQGVHIAMDSTMRYEHQPLAPFGRWRYRGWIRSNTKTEFALSSLSLIVVLAA